MLFTYVPYMQECSKCKRKILVEVFLNGTNHNVDLLATCADCITLDENSQFAKENSKVFESIKQWLAKDK